MAENAVEYGNEGVDYHANLCCNQMRTWLFLSLYPVPFLGGFHICIIPETLSNVFSATLRDRREKIPINNALP